MKIAFYVGKKGLFDAAVRLLTWSETSHCELVFSDGQCFSSSGRDGGPRFKEIDLASGRWKVFDLDRFEVHEDRARALCRQITAEARSAGAGYDYAGVLRFVLPFLPQAAEDWCCSEVCLHVLQVWADYLPIELYGPPHKYDPGTIMEVLERLGVAPA